MNGANSSRGTKSSRGSASSLVLVIFVPFVIVVAVWLGTNVGEHESISFHYFANADAERVREHRPVPHERVKFAVLTTRIDSSG